MKTGRNSAAKIVLGLILVGFWLVMTLLQVQTNEAFILGGGAVSFHADWSILAQPVKFILGTQPTSTAEATAFGWGIELFFLIFVVGYEIAHDAVSEANKDLAKFFKTATILIVLFDAYTDYRYGQLASGFWGQVLFAVVVGLIVMFFGTIGLRYIEHGFSSMTHHGP
jgi:hypothetical protein